MIYTSKWSKVLRSGFAVLIMGLPVGLANGQVLVDSASPSQSVPSQEQEPNSEILIGSSPEQKPTSELKIGSGDLLEVSVFGAPEFAKTVRVSGAGDISLPLIGSVKVAGLSIVQAQALVSKRLIDG